MGAAYKTSAENDALTRNEEVSKDAFRCVA